MWDQSDSEFIQDNWVSMSSNRKLLYHCWNYPRIHKQIFRNSTTADYVDAVLSSKGFGWRKFSFPSSLSLPHPPLLPTAFVVPHLLPMEKTDVTSPLRGTLNAPNVSFIHSCFPCEHLFLVGEEGRSKHSLYWPPREWNVCQTSLIHSSDN